MSKQSDSINRQFRLNDQNRWIKSHFIVGYEIHRSNNPDNTCSICQQLIGKYPKTFFWPGWHDGCKCFTTPILQDTDEFNTDELNELKAALNGTEYIPVEPSSIIHVLPVNFIMWYANEVQNMLDKNTFPDFVVKNMDIISKSVAFYRTK